MGEIVIDSKENLKLSVENLLDVVDSADSDISSLCSNLSGISNCDGIDVASAASTIVNNFKNLMLDYSNVLHTAENYINNFIAFDVNDFNYIGENSNGSSYASGKSLSESSGGTVSLHASNSSSYSGGSSASFSDNGSASYSSVSSGDVSSQSNVNYSNNVGSDSIIDTSSPVSKKDGYSLSEDELNTLAYIAYREQGSVEGAKIELSLMCNLYEKNKSSFSSVYSYVQNSGWFGDATGVRSAPSADYYAAAVDVMNNGNRYLADNVVEHDCLSDISYAANDGSSINVYDKSSYVPGKTVLHNVYGADYVFVGFAPNGGDPFGYLV